MLAVCKATYIYYTILYYMYTIIYSTLYMTVNLPFPANSPI